MTNISLKDLLFNTGMGTEDKLNFILSCSITRDPITIELIAQNLYQLRDSADITKVMKIFLQIAYANDLSIPPQASWVLCEYGQRRIEDMVNLLLEEIIKKPQEERWRWERYTAPRILRDIVGNTNSLALSLILIKWAEDSSLKTLVVETIKMMLYDIPYTNERFYDNCLNLISLIAKRDGIDVENIIKRSEDKRLKCAKIIDKIHQGKISYDIVSAKQNLQNYPNIKRFLGNAWLNVNEGNEPPLLAVFLSQLDLSFDIYNDFKEVTGKEKVRLKIKQYDQVRVRALLLHIEILLQNIDPQEFRIGMLRNQLRSENFEVGLSELELISRLRNGCEVECYPEVERVNGKKNMLDALVHVDSNEILIEMITPELMPELRYIGVASVPNRLADKVWSEFEDQIKNIVKQRDVILFVDKSRSEITYESAVDYMQGPIKIVIRVNKQTRKEIDSYLIRDKAEAMNQMNPAMNIIIGILIYDRFLGKDFKYHIRGRFIENPVISKAQRELAEKITSVFLG